jgi:uncharacterized protein (TIGR03437 family)
MKKLPVLAIFFTLASVSFGQNLTIVNAASNSAVSVAPNSIISIKGSNLAAKISVAEDPSNPPTTLGGVSVTIGGTAASLFYASPKQINALVSATTPLGSQTVVVTVGSAKQTGTVTVATNAPPGLFSLSGSGMRDGAIVNASSFELGSFVTITPNGPTYLALFGTGISLTSAPTVTVGGVSSQVVFYGAAPCCAGVEQVNAVLPNSTSGSGRVPVMLSSNGQNSNTVQIVVLPASTTTGPGHTRSRELSNLAYIPNTSLVLTTDENDDVVRVTDVKAQKVTQVITLPAGSGPTSIAVNSAGTLAVVAESDRGKAAILDLAKFMVTTEISTGMSPVSVAIAGDQAIVANQDTDNVSVIDLTASTVQKTVSVGHGPAAVGVDAGAKQAYVVNEADGLLSVIDLNNLAVTKTIALGEATRGEAIAVVPGAATVFVTVPAAGPAGQLLMINLSTGTVTKFEANPERSGGATSIVYNNGHLYLTNQTGASITVLPSNPASATPTVLIKVGEGVRALAIDTKDNLLVAGNQGPGTLSLIDLNSNKVVGTINAVASSEGSDSDGDDHSDRGTAYNVPLINKLSPNTANAGTTFQLTIDGRHLNGATAVAFVIASEPQPGKQAAPQPDPGFTVTNINASSDGTQLTATVTIAASVKPGTWHVQVTTPNGENLTFGTFGFPFKVVP